MIDSGEEGGLFRIGVATLTGVLAFLVLEKVLAIDLCYDLVFDSFLQVLEMSNPETNPKLREKENKKIVGYLNLLANCTDNLLHGLAVDLIHSRNQLLTYFQRQDLTTAHQVGSSFLSSSRLGITTTAAILLHEVRKKSKGHNLLSY